MNEDYPRTLLELEERFSVESACRAYLYALRWPMGFLCPVCGASEAWAMDRGLWLCRGCRHQVSVMAGTIFQDTHLPLTTWFRAMWYVTSQKNGVSALGLQRILGLGSYKTAWALLHKLRRAMVRPGRDRLRGIEEVTARSLHDFIADAVEPRSTVRTDGLNAYLGLQSYEHDRPIQRDHGPKARLLPRVHQVISLLKRWLLGTHQGAIGHDHLAYYLDEFTFRFNQRKSKSRGKLFYRLVQQAVQVGPVPFESLTNHNP